MDFNNKTFKSITNTANGEVGDETLFHYKQKDKVVWAEYSGGAIVKGFLIAKVLENNALDMRYEHINQAGELMTGVCHSSPEILSDAESDCTKNGNGQAVIFRRENQ